MSKYAEYRREFHKYPENGWREIRTSARIAEITFKYLVFIKNPPFHLILMS